MSLYIWVYLPGPDYTLAAKTRMPTFIVGMAGCGSVGFVLLLMGFITRAREACI